MREKKGKELFRKVWETSPPELLSPSGTLEKAKSSVPPPPAAFQGQKRRGSERENIALRRRRRRFPVPRVHYDDQVQGGWREKNVSAAFAIYVGTHKGLKGRIWTNTAFQTKKPFSPFSENHQYCKGAPHAKKPA